MKPKNNARPKEAARRIVARHCKHGISRSEAKQLGKISSLGTERSYRQCISNFLAWCELNGTPRDLQSNKTTLISYLEERSEYVQQKTLDQERQSLEMVYKQKLQYVRSLQVSLYDKRSYTLSQVNLIVVHQSKNNAITTFLAFYAGLRAHESATILPLKERSASIRRKWDDRRFMGRSSYRVYTVIGKGGLIREVAVPIWLSDVLETLRRPPVVIFDREISYLSHYAIGVGHAWSQSFSVASKIALGFSTGGHGLRHSYAKWRLKVLRETLENNEQQCIEEQSLLILSQELGHFAITVTFAYLR